jgi:hypothetical protein
LPNIKIWDQKNSELTGGGVAIKQCALECSLSYEFKARSLNIILLIVLQMCGTMEEYWTWNLETQLHSVTLESPFLLGHPL